MTPSPAEAIVQSLRKTHGLLLSVVADLSDDQIRYQPNSTTPPIAFHLWHLARYADSLADQVGLEADSIWESELLATWGFDPSVLGIYQSGTGMEAEAAGALAWPDKESLMDYVHRAFGQADRALGDVERFAQPPKWGGSSVAVAITTHVEHVNRHLGMIEGMRGVLGLRGSATE